MRKSLTPTFITSSTLIIHPVKRARLLNRCQTMHIKMVTSARLVRQIRPSAMRNVLPVLATPAQTKLHMGNSRYVRSAYPTYIYRSNRVRSAILDRVLAAVLLLFLLHLLPGTRILTLFKALAMAWPLLQPFLKASARNARLRRSAAYIVRGNVFVRYESGKKILFVEGVQTGIPVQEDIEGVGYGFIVGGRLRAVWCDQLFCTYPYITARRMQRLVNAFVEPFR